MTRTFETKHGKVIGLITSINGYVVLRLQREKDFTYPMDIRIEIEDTDDIHSSMYKCLLENLTIEFVESYLELATEICPF